MAQANITRIQPADNPTYMGQNGTMYAFDVELSDGSAGQVSCKTPDRWKVGDAVEYTSRSSFHGPKLSLSKPGYGTSNNAPQTTAPDDTTKGIVASWAVGLGMQVADRTAGNYDVQVMQYARLALEARKQLKNEVEL
jgi:hypothetical protein